jgi:hypothetical protein
MPAFHALILEIRARWLAQAIPGPGGAEVLRWRACRVFDKQPDEDIFAPIRHLRVLYALSDEHYDNARQNLILAGHEFLISATQLANYPAPAIQNFLRTMTPARQYYRRAAGH